MNCFIKNKNLALLFSFALIFSCQKEEIGATFTEIDSPTDYELSCIKFANTDIGFACGGSQFNKSELIRTLNGGETWQVIPLPQNVERKQLYALDVLSNGAMEVVGFGGVTYHSNYFGFDISFQQDPRWAHWRGICFRNQDEAFACGQDDLRTGFVSKISSVDNWKYPFIDDRHPFAMYHITFPDSLHGYIAGFGAIYKSKDGGNTWRFTSAENDYYTATVWFSNSEGVAVGWEGSILRTENGGADWETIRNGNKITQKKIRLKSLAKNNDTEIVAAGENGCLLYSNDKGQSWKSFGDFTDVNFESVAFQDNDTFFAVGDDGRIFKVQL